MLSIQFNDLRLANDLNSMNALHARTRLFTLLRAINACTHSHSSEIREGIRSSAVLRCFLFVVAVVVVVELNSTAEHWSKASSTKENFIELNYTKR